MKMQKNISPGKTDSSKNPQSNAIFERMHQTVENVLRTLLYSNPPRIAANAADLIDQVMSTYNNACNGN